MRYYICFMHLIPVETLSRGSWVPLPGAMPHKLWTSFSSASLRSPAAPELTDLPRALGLPFAQVAGAEDVKAQLGRELAVLGSEQALSVAQLTEVDESWSLLDQIHLSFEHYFSGERPDSTKA